MLARLKTVIEFVGAHAAGLLLLTLILTLGAWAFISIADEVREGGTQRFDDWAIRALRKPDDPQQPIGPKWVGEVARDVTALGGVTVLTLVTLTVVGYLWLEDRYGALWLVVAATVGGICLSTALKHVYHRPRPQLVAHLSAVYTSSFPSGHSMLSATVYLTLGMMLARLVRQRRLKFYFITQAIGLTFIIGVSRVFMGVHYPTDVLAGWAAGLTWALVCGQIAHYLQRRGAVEQTVEPTED